MTENGKRGIRIWASDFKPASGLGSASASDDEERKTVVKRKFLEDGDTVVLRGWCCNDDDYNMVGFGECVGTIEPALELGL